MLILDISFGLLWIACCIYAFWRGGWEGRWTGTLFFVAALLSPLAGGYARQFGMKNIGLLSVDASLLLALCVIAARTNRYWPLWLVGLHSLTVCAELVALIDGRPLAGAYEALQAFWSIPVLSIMAYGVLLDRREDQRQHVSVDSGGGPRVAKTPQATS
jgi:hypothetical protein